MMVGVVNRMLEHPACCTVLTDELIYLARYRLVREPQSVLLSKLSRGQLQDRQRLSPVMN